MAAGDSLESLLSKRVQEMAINGEQPPSPYVRRDDADSSITQQQVPSALCPLPLIDLGLLSSSPTTPIAEQNHELEKLRSALSSWGCFQAINHGVSSSLLDEVGEVGRKFFEQPMEEKNRVLKGVEKADGYGTDPAPEEGQSLNWSDRLYLTVYPEDSRDYEFWPPNPSSFRDVLEEYTRKMREVTEVVSRGMAKSLNLEEKCFLNQFGEEATLQVRFNYYPCCKWPDLVLGLKAHTDGSGYTIILQDDVEGLQVHHDGKWFNIPTIPHALLVIMGEQMEIMSNGVFKSPLHRAVINSEKDRMSIAMFYTPQSNIEIGPEDGLVSEEKPRMFKKVKDYVNTYWWGYYKRGIRAIDAAKV
ncbi:protein SRG1-like [Senna tora]|uniref:Protein SRG1-like n=1 Tax=Senna tora TaxID=362788 RepID=A0A834T3E8_9FABA|nr:protein SRG1-like [Senna tora]